MERRDAKGLVIPEQTSFAVLCGRLRLERLPLVVVKIRKLLSCILHPVSRSPFAESGVARYASLMVITRRSGSMQPPIYIAIEGVIGVGKTTLARLLQRDYEAELVLEVFEQNPFLPLFYAEPERYAFQTQIVFLLSRYRQQQAVRERAGQSPLLSDYLFAKDRLFAQMNLQGDEWETYEHLHHALAEQIAQPDLVVYLRASVDTLMARIAQRDRPYERGMAREYIARLAQAYDRFFDAYASPALLIVDTDDLNILTQDDLSRVRERVRAAVNTGIYQQRLPLDEQMAQPLVSALRNVIQLRSPNEPAPRVAADPLLTFLQLQHEMGGLAAALRRHREGDAQDSPAALQQAMSAAAQNLLQLARDLDINLEQGSNGADTALGEAQRVPMDSSL